MTNTKLRDIIAIMENIFWSIILMSFILWANQKLTRYQAAQANNNGTLKTYFNAFSIKQFCKQLLVIILLFAVCYCFIMLVSGNKPTIHRYTIENPSHNENVQQPTNNENAVQDPFAKKLAQNYFEILQPQQITTNFHDVAGLQEAKNELQDLVDFLHNPSKFQRLGAKPPKGVLLYGTPGTGKTLLARALAGEARVCFIATSGSQFEEEYVGVGAARIRELFNLARKQAPCVIFIDEIDSIAFKRHGKNNPAWSAQAVNQLLSEMDGLNDSLNKGIVVIAASNRIDVLDKAILRPGRLDRHIKLELPTLSEREAILEIYLRKIKTDYSVTAKKVAKITTNFSSAELANLVNEAAIESTRKNQDSVDLAAFETAKDRFILGSTRKAMAVSENDKQITAYHEAGHALVGHLLNEHDPIYKVTIAPRGPSLGHTSFSPKNEEYSYSRKRLEHKLASTLGGRIAEEIIFGEEHITTGAESDLRVATQLALNMVTKWGYSKNLGVAYHDAELNLFSKKKIEQEVKKLLEEAYTTAKTLLTNNKEQLHKLAKELIEQETLDNQQVEKILGKKIG